MSIRPSKPTLPFSQGLQNTPTCNRDAELEQARLKLCSIRLSTEEASAARDKAIASAEEVDVTLDVESVDTRYAKAVSMLAAQIFDAAEEHALIPVL